MIMKSLTEDLFYCLSLFLYGIDLINFTNTCKLYNNYKNSVTKMVFDSWPLENTKRSLDIYEIKFIINFPNLISFNIENTNVKNLHHLNRLHTYKLKKIILADTPIYDIYVLCKYVSLLYLDISWTPVRSLDPLYWCNNLEILYIRDTKVKTLEPIKELTNLIDIDISKCNIDTFSLNNNSLIESINLAWTQILNIDVFMNYKYLKHINLYNQYISYDILIIYKLIEKDICITYDNVRNCYGYYYNT